MMEVDGWWRKEMRDGECVGETDDGEQRETGGRDSKSQEKKMGVERFPETNDKGQGM
eukprot:CAMPEP_0184335478 /NCGR_PEP_ID=MMETSP1089-20130417/4034_1 /TAXON_ID=38269 ORGANISM="Gloeochaete wittrockiana, Strain SAG46.84" /NCGR_SAMPLE_ID=MMETSP1089 /ASSEMBLY_ACC=CAM_ASM_000445 /LENGTH=56 /DNA_ID=CAMNT_0026660145 /DNA_START=60 /DNA_END=230 /DNA_ORIENTATION=-